MKILIASDIHGSAYYCEKLTEFYKESGADRLVILGDVLYHGPRNALPKEYEPQNVVGMLNRIRDEVICIKGNCEADVDLMLLDFKISENCHIFLNGSIIYAEHGHVNGEHNPPALAKGSVLVNGHTHIPAFVRYDGFTYVNPGSVSLPKDNYPHSVIVTDGKCFDFYDIETKEIYRRESL